MGGNARSAPQPPPGLSPWLSVPWERHKVGPGQGAAREWGAVGRNNLGHFSPAGRVSSKSRGLEGEKGAGNLLGVRRRRMMKDQE